MTICREQAVRTVSVPTEVVNVLTDLRSYLQDKLEPPVYVSDRRLVKSVALLQVRTVLRDEASQTTSPCEGYFKMHQVITCCHKFF